MMALGVLDSEPCIPRLVEESVKSPFRFIAWITLVLFVTVGSFDTALAQTISLSTNNLVFCVPSTSSPAPAPQTLTVNSTTAGQSANFNASATKPWILLNGQRLPPPTNPP